MTAPGRVIGSRCRLVQTIAVGGMGQVCEAGDELLRRRVAVTQLLARPGLGDADPAPARDRVIREARITTRLTHAASPGPRPSARSQARPLSRAGEAANRHDPVAARLDGVALLCASLLAGWARRFLEVGASVLRAPVVRRRPGHPDPGAAGEVSGRRPPTGRIDRIGSAKRD